MLKCRECDEEKDESEFRLGSMKKNGKRYRDKICKACVNASRNEWRYKKQKPKGKIGLWWLTDY